MTDDQIASLDSRWDVFPESEQAALKATRILTIRPFAFGDREVADLKKHFNDAQVIDILYTVARYNAVNRWTSSTGIPQIRRLEGMNIRTRYADISRFASVKSSVIPTDILPRPQWNPDRTYCQNLNPQGLASHESHCHQQRKLRKYWLAIPLA